MALVTTYEKDIAKYLIVNNIVDSSKFKLLRNPWVSNTIYDFKIDLKPGST